MKASAGANTANASAAPAGTQTTGLNQERRAMSVRYPALISSSANLGPTAGNKRTPNSAGAAAAPSVLMPRARQS